jgi:hypothetical protein
MRERCVNLIKQIVFVRKTLPHAERRENIAPACHHTPPPPTPPLPRRAAAGSCQLLPRRLSSMFGFLGKAVSAVNPFRSRTASYQPSGAAGDGGGDDDDETPLLSAHSDSGESDATPGLLSHLASAARGGNRGRNRETNRRGDSGSSDVERCGDVNTDRHPTAMYSLGPANTAGTEPRANRPGRRERPPPYMDSFADATFTHDNEGNELSPGMAASRRRRADYTVNPTNPMDASGGVGASWGVGAGGGGVSSSGGGVGHDHGYGGGRNPGTLALS